MRLFLVFFLLIPRAALATVNLNIVLYSTKITYGGNTIGTTRSVVNSNCYTDPQFSVAGCQSDANTWALLGLSGESNYYNNVIPGTATTFSASKAVFGINGVQIAQNWSTLILGTWNNLWVDAGMTVVSENGFAWSGITASGQPDTSANTCDYWTSDSSSVYAKVVVYYSSSSMGTSVLQHCGEINTITCACLVSTSLPPPVASGTPVVFSTNATYLGGTIPSTRAAANAACLATPAGAVLQCSSATTWGVLPYVSDGTYFSYGSTVIPGTTTHFSSGPVYGPYGTQIAPTWASLWSNPIQPATTGLQYASLQALQSPPSCTAGSCIYYTGFSGHLNPTSGSTDCNGWTTNSSSTYNVMTADTSAPPLDSGNPELPCSTVGPFLCACLSPALLTHSPTLAPSRAPSHSPSKTPSKAPSKTPSRSPSQTPTTSHPSLTPTSSPLVSARYFTPIIFATNRQFTGSEIGSRAQSTESCRTDVNNQLSCEYISMLVSYPGQSPPLSEAFVPGTSIAFDGSKPVFSPDGHVLASNWSQLYRFGINYAMAAVDIDPSDPFGTPQNVWTGTGVAALRSPANGFPASPEQTCDGWNSSSPVDQGIVGNTRFTSYAWYSTPFGTAGTTCDNAHPALCLCLSTVPATFSPTVPPFPSTAPTQWPTAIATEFPTSAPSHKLTSSPSASPTATDTIWIYATTNEYAGALMGNQNVTLETCANDMQASEFKCAYTWPLLWYTYYDPTLSTTIPGTSGVGIPQSVPVRGSAGLPLATNWYNFIILNADVMLLNTINAAVTNAGFTIWSGMAGSNCNNWANTYPQAGGTLAYVTTTGVNWFNVYGLFSDCSVGETNPRFLCACWSGNTPAPTLPTRSPVSSASPTIQPTSPSPTFFPFAFPSPQPTHLPSKGPSRAPSVSPTRRPTNHPSAHPTRTPSHTPTQRPNAPTSFSPSRSPVRTPSRSPSRAPSRAPSQSPTRRPTTRTPSRSPSHSPSRSPSHSPSQSPTAAPVVIKVFVTSTLYESTWGANSVASGYCASDSQATALSCVPADTWAFLWYGSTPCTSTIPGTSTTIPASATVYGSKGGVLATNWNNFCGTGTLTNTISAEVTLPPSVPGPWVGYSEWGSAGNPDGNCNNWAGSPSSSVAGVYADTTSTASGWWGSTAYTAYYDGCATYYPATRGLLCICLAPL